MVKLFQSKRHLSSKEKLNAVYAIYGSLSNFEIKRSVSFA